ncbi:HNH endonuclease [Vibrio fluvialis]|nr:HNH endonuclease [Vibrio fluvialis]
MGKLADTYLKYGVASDVSIKLEELGLSVTTFRALNITQLVDKYNLDKDEVSWVKRAITRKAIDPTIVHDLLENSNYICCCCKGLKSDSYIIHHIVEYEVSQNNEYDNLAVLCPNDHDLAHSNSNLTNKLSSEHIIESKKNWEREIKLHNISVSKEEQREQVLTKLPRYKVLNDEIVNLKNSINDKEKIITRSEAYFDVELTRKKQDLQALEHNKELLERQVSELAIKLSQLDLSKSSELNSLAVSAFLNGDLEEALKALNESNLDSELEKIDKAELDLLKSIKENYKCRILKSQLLLINERCDEAIDCAVKALEVSERLIKINSDIYIVDYINSLEEIGTIFYTSGKYEVAYSYFEGALGICIELFEKEIFEHFPLFTLVLQNMGACHYSQGEYDRALKLLIDAEEKIVSIKTTLAKFNETELVDLDRIHLMVLTNIGASCQELNLNDDGLKYYSQGEVICERLIASRCNSYDESIFRYLHNTAMLNFQSKNYGVALRKYNESLPYINRLIKDRRSMFIVELADTYRDICSCHLSSGDTHSAEKFCDDAIKLFCEIGSSQGAKIEMHYVDSLVYKMILLMQKKEDLNEINRLGELAISICLKHPEDTDAQNYPETINTILSASSSAFTMV